MFRQHPRCGRSVRLARWTLRRRGGELTAQAWANGSQPGTVAVLGPHSLLTVTLSPGTGAGKAVPLRSTVRGTFHCRGYQNACAISSRFIFHSLPPPIQIGHVAPFARLHLRPNELHHYVIILGFLPQGVCSRVSPLTDTNTLGRSKLTLRESSNLTVSLPRVQGRYAVS